MDKSDKLKIEVSSLTESVQPAVRKLAELLLDFAGENLLSFTVFGAAVAEDFDPQRMPVRSLVVLEKMDLALLNQLRSHGPRLGRQRLQAPLFMTEGYIDQSRDSFPIELLEIQQLHAVVLGRDFFESLEFSRTDVRLQCERELKTNLITLRQGLLSAHKDALIAPLLAAAMDHILRVLRAVLWLKDIECPSNVAGILSAAQGLIDWKLAGLANCLAQTNPATFKQFEPVYRDIESLSKYVNEISL